MSISLTYTIRVGMTEEMKKNSDIKGQNALPHTMRLWTNKSEAQP